MRRVAILGATGSIGRSALDVVRALAPECRVVGLSARSDWRGLAEAAREFRPRVVGLADEQAAEEFARAAGSNGAAVVAGPTAAAKVASAEDADVVVSAIVGSAGLEPTLAALRAGKRVALANKEALVMAGPLVLEEARRSGAEILPVDSEHSAVFQAGLAGRREEVSRVILTASGGPFLRRPAEEFGAITPEEALAHPTWSMGEKITVDSATLMNKALEVIEARWLFGADPSDIEVWIHPQSVVHSMVEFADGSVVAQLGVPDMRVPIQYALTHPDRLPGTCRRLTIEDMTELTFERPDLARFPALELGYRAAREGGTAGAALNAANEVLVEAFLDGRCGFVDVPRLAARVMDLREEVPSPSLGDIWEADELARARARSAIEESPELP